jgi:hypothetical protein
MTPRRTAIVARVIGFAAAARAHRDFVDTASESPATSRAL